MRHIDRRELLGGMAAASLASPLAAAAPAPSLLDRTAEHLLGEYPENATLYGVDNGARAALRSHLTDRSWAAEQRRRDWAKTELARIEAAPRAGLAPADALNLDVAQEAFRLAVAGWAFPFGDTAVLSGTNSFRNTPFVVTQLSGAFVDVPDFLDSKHVIAGRADVDSYLARVEAYARQLSDEADRIDADRARGVVPPDFILDLVLGQMVPARALPPARWGIVETLRRGAPTAAPRAERLVAGLVAPAMDRQIAALRRARAVATPEPGVWKQPQGADWYAWALRAGTTTTASADEIHRLGLAQIGAIQAEMDGLLRAQGLTQGTVGDRMTALGRRPDLLFANDDAGRAKLLAYLNDRVDDIRGRMPRGFATLVPGKLVVKRVPPAIEAGAPNGYAAPGSIDGRLPGNYYINLRDTSIWPRYALPTLCYHEGIPGHVWQGEYANRLPLIRTHLAFNAYSEGWALYSEQLGDELGAYEDDPLGRLGYLQSIGFRACRLVVDTGLHAKRWSFDRALGWFRANTGMTEAQLRSELNRYCAMPGQACGYKMGHNRINQLRDKAEAALGVRFDLRRFDDAMVLSGNVPLTMLGPIVDRYIAAARG